MLAHLARLILLSAEDQLAAIGLRPRHLVALTIIREHGNVAQGDLATLLRMDGRNVVGLLNELEADDLVLRRRSSSDRRRYIVALTSNGQQLLVAAESAVSDAENAVLAALEPGARDQLDELLRQATADHVLDPNVGIGAGEDRPIPASKA